MKNLSTTGRYILRVFAAVLFAVGALSLAATGANASHFGETDGPDATATFIPHDEQKNPTCGDFNSGWTELKQDPPGNGSESDAKVTVEVSHFDGSTFDWRITSGADKVGGLDAVVVKTGKDGHNLYTYDPEEVQDDQLVSPGTNAISHISFCYDEGGGPTTTAPTTTEETTTTVEETTTTAEATTTTVEATTTTVEATTTTVEATTTTAEATTTSAAEVQSNVTERETEVAGVQVTQPPAPQVESGQLARTGMSDWLAPFGVFLIAMGVGALRVSRTPKPAQVIAR